MVGYFSLGSRYLDIILNLNVGWCGGKMWNDAECGNQAAACGCAVVLWWCCCCGGVEVCREEEETLERWTSASAETSHGVIMMSRRHGARSDCLLCLQCCNVLTQTSFLSTAVSDDGCSVCCCHGAAKLTTNRHYQPIDSYKRVLGQSSVYTVNFTCKYALTKKSMMLH